MFDVFISYKSEERDSVRPIATTLQNSGWNVWWDPMLEPSDVAYTKQIWRALTSAKAVIVVWSEASVSSDWVTGEATTAKDQGTFIQLRIDGVRLRPPFNVLECLDLVGWRGDEQSTEWRRLILHITRSTGKDVQHQAEDSLHFDLHPRILEAIRAARNSESRSRKAQVRAAHAAELADKAVARARRGLPGTMCLTTPDGRLEGESYENRLEGHGALTASVGDYRGSFKSNAVNGHGVLTVDLPGATFNSAIRYEGDFLEGRPTGYGVFHQKDGTTCAGGAFQGEPTGWGVKALPNGRRFEGELIRGQPHGLGAEFDEGGIPVASGDWEKGILVREF